MIISCPECTAKFLVDAAALGATGRMVRCGKCAHTWAETPPETISENVGAPVDAEPARDSEQGPEENSESEPPFDEADDSDDSDFEPDSDPEPDAESPRGRRTGPRTGVPALQQKPTNIVAQLSWGLLIVLVLGVSGGGVFFQNQVIETWPAAKRLYALIGLTQEPLGVGLNLVNVKFSQLAENGGGLLVEGEVENTSDHVLDVPSLRATLFDKKKISVQHWPFEATLPRLLPGENVKFKTIIKNPAKGAVRIEIDFHEARQGKPE
ncbi:MAG: zinc-ribbon domain-containing protein [Rhodospirillales bacterium]|nr:zinc-ribbon domain-containing protein [Rhodospirillales bacterium]